MESLIEAIFLFLFSVIFFKSTAKQNTLVLSKTELNRASGRKPVSFLLTLHHDLFVSWGQETDSFTPKSFINVS